MTLSARIDVASLAPAELQELADVLRPYLGLGDPAEWLTPEMYHAKGYAPTLSAARRRASRALAEGKPWATKQGNRVYLRGPSFGGLKRWTL